jgi:hypothetical protein
LNKALHIVAIILFGIFSIIYSESNSDNSKEIKLEYQLLAKDTFEIVNLVGNPILTIPKSSTFSVVNPDDNSTFWEIEFNGKKGYINKSLLGQETVDNIVKKVENHLDSLKNNKTKAVQARPAKIIIESVVFYKTKNIKYPGYFLLKNDMVYVQKIENKWALVDFRDYRLNENKSRSEPNQYLEGWIKTNEFKEDTSYSDLFSDDQERLRDYVRRNYYKCQEFRDNIIKGEILIGMTKDIVELILGKLPVVNQTIGKWGVHEQCEHGNSYIYFENGKFTSIQSK